MKRKIKPLIFVMAILGIAYAFYNLLKEFSELFEDADLDWDD